MPRKKNVSTTPEEPLAENQKGQAVSAELGETEEAGLPLEAEAVDLSPKAEGTDFPPETGSGDFPLGENPYPDSSDIDAGTEPASEESAGEPPTGEEPAGAEAASEEPVPAEPGDVSDGEVQNTEFSAEGDLPTEGIVPVEDPLQGAAQEADPEYDALLHEWSEVNSAQAQNGEDSEAPLVLSPPPGTEPESLPEPEAPVSSSEGVPGNDAADAPPRAARPRRRRTPASDASATSATSRRTQERERVLTIEARDEIQTEDDREAAIWHEIQNADWTRRILTGTLDGVEQTESGLTLAIVSYKGFRVAIPIKEMLLYPGKLPTGPEYLDTMDRLRRILMTRLGSEIDFVVKGHDNKSRSAVGSRKDAMYRKRQSFYLDKDELGEPMIYEGRVVQARVVAVAEKIIRVEVFGVECAIVARGLSRSWVGDATEKYSVGDRILVRVLKISGSTAEDLSITVDVRSVFKGGDQDNLKKCSPGGRYAGRVTDIRGGVVYIRLNNGVNAIAHSCYDRRAPGKRDDVSFSVTRIDPEQGVAIGIITRIIKQNL